MINAPVTSSLYGFVPICEIFSFTCSDVEGIAIQLRLNMSNSTGGRQTNISKLRQEIEEEISLIDHTGDFSFELLDQALLATQPKEISSDMKFEIKSL